MYRVIRLKLLELPSQLLQHAGIAHGVPQQVGLVQQTARLLALCFQRLGAGDEVLVLGVGEGHLRGDVVPEHLILVQHAVGAAVVPLFHNQPGNVHAGGGHIVVAAALAQVDLKHAVVAGGAAVLDVKVGKTGVAAGLQHLTDVLHQRQGGRVLTDDGGMVAQAVGGVLLDHRVAKAHGADLAVLVGERRQHAHVVVAARHHLLQDHAVRVAAGIDRFDDLGGLGGGGGGVDLLHRVKRMLPVINAGRRLDDDGVGKAQFILGQLGGIDRCGQNFRVGVGDAELLADLVELGLFLDGAVQVGGRAGGDILGQLGLAADDHRGVIVGAAEQIEPFALMLCRKLVQNAQHRVLVVHIGHGGKVDDFGILGRSHRVAAIGVALDAVSLMERPGKVVAVQVCTKEYRDNVGHGKVHLQFFKLGFP